jgi:hypothetical protein
VETWREHEETPMNIESNAQHTLTLANGARAHREHVA